MAAAALETEREGGGVRLRLQGLTDGAVYSFADSVTDSIADGVADCVTENLTRHCRCYLGSGQC